MAGTQPQMEGDAQLLDEIDQTFSFEVGAESDHGTVHRRYVRRSHVYGATLAVTLVLGCGAAAARWFTPVHAALRHSVEQLPLEEEFGVIPAPGVGAQNSADQCSWEGEDCTKTTCCRRQGFSCWKKNEYWASCSTSAEKLQDFSEDGLKWEGTRLGGSAVIPPIVKVPAGTGMGTSLFCFTVVTPQGVVPKGVEPGYEQTIIDQTRTKQIGIFQCEASKVYEGTRVGTGDWHSIVNTDIFVKTWKQVQADAIYQQHDWTVKVDTDAVFFPFRLKYHLEQLSPAADSALYVKNIDFKFGFMGSLEVISKKAVDIYLAGVDKCADHLGHNGGEDKFTMGCLDSLGVGHLRDNSLLNDKYMSGQAFHLFDVDPCVDQGNVAFHPYKHINAWMGCWDVSMQKQKTTYFVGCDQRFPGDACSLTSTLSHASGGHGKPMM